MPRRAHCPHKQEVILAGVFAKRLLSVVEQRFAVTTISDE